MRKQINESCGTYADSEQLAECRYGRGLAPTCPRATSTSQWRCEISILAQHVLEEPTMTATRSTG
ncbi:hypothetical protein VFPPC_18043 [Pochonia chlamydosporia 170]|uniref:Uncharacterized protein n=1 Tax=Pochonia chlamydosporia 170 TaxID=1380566 RepID=A0A219APQ1_METCM|nr:hypothetical protein VFPPC_18043 [Pochonia chlamydosporia 170]OWT42788.1 hypothetical protein VFPPC_18043 [Pochonia chlamydosporia 170]